jgi:RHS repeat-associated protein
VAYGRDALGRIEEVTTREDAMATPVTVASSIAYEPFGPVAGLTWGNGLEAVYAHDEDYRLTGLDVADGATVIQDLAYGYDGRDDITSITDNETPARTQAFAYDALARLIEADGAYGLIEYEYDAVGNRTLRRVTTGGAVEKTYAYDSVSNRLETETRPGAVRAFTYDEAGNVVEDDQGGAEPTFTLHYNDAGRLVQVDEDATPTTEYALNAFGERVVKQPYGTPASATHYHYALDGTLLAESEADGDASVEYIVLPGVGAAGLPLALVPDPQGDPDELAYIHADHLGSAQAITDAGQAIDWDLVAGPFGELEDLTATLAYNPRLPGQVADVETGYRQNRFRDYDPSIGRYLQSDPIGLEGGLNTYAYVEGNPVNIVDPLGLDAFMCRKPLSWLPGDGQRNGPDWSVNPLFHQFVCVKIDDKVVCAGQRPEDRTDLFSPGAPTSDHFDDEY